MIKYPDNSSSDEGAEAAEMLPANDEVSYMPPYKSAPSLTFHIVTGERELLSKVRSMMQRQGFLLLREDDGRMAYLFDGQEVQRSGQQIAEVIEAQTVRHGSRGADEELLRRIDRAMLRHLFNPDLTGYNYMRYIVFLLVKNPSLRAQTFDFIYRLAGRQFNTERNNVERAIRYLIKRAGLKQSNGRTIMQMYYTVSAELREQNAFRTVPPPEGPALPS
ncbi:MAG: sporulation initiation factor Spo0A C-terminal domain-containing protein [Saccharofermentanales bacterium]|nr:hypothetical protein [Clostridiaceae bacterium]